MTESRFYFDRKTLLPVLFALLVLICLPVAGLAQAAEQKKDEEMPVQNVVFKNASLKAALATMGKQLPINVVFDETLKDSRLSIELKDVTIKAAMKIILTQQSLQARLIEDKTIIIFPDNEASRKRYGQHKVWPGEPEK